MKIVICNTLYPPDGIGGPERSVKITAEGLVALGHEVTVIGQGFDVRDRTSEIEGVKRIALGAPPGFAPVVADGGGKVRTIKKRLFSALPFDLLGKYCRAIEREQPDVVHTNVVHAIDRLWDEVAARGIPLVHTLRIYNVMCNERMYFQDAECRTQCAPCRKKFAPRIPSSNRVAAVVGISRYVLQRHLNEGFFVGSPLKYVVGNPYDAAAPLVSAASASTPAAQVPRLLFMGRIHPSKGIRVFTGLVQNTKRGALRFRVCGRGHPAYEAEIQSLLAGHDVEWLGFSAHEAAFEGVDWLVVPSLWGEPFGRVVIEAFAHGIPVIASSGGAFPELVEHGKNGFLFDPEDPEALETIARGIAEGRFDRRKMSEEALRTAEKYSAARIAARYAEVYESAIHHPGSQAG